METQGEDSDQKPLKEERDLHAENYDFKQKLFLSKFGFGEVWIEWWWHIFLHGISELPSFYGILQLYKTLLWVSDGVEHSTRKSERKLRKQC